MSTLGIVLLVIAVGYFGLRLLLRLVGYRITSSPEYQSRMAEFEASRQVEDEIIEEAAWIGTTGLDEETERELSKYLRREFGERVLDKSSVKASDLSYVGKFSERDLVVHYWRVPSSHEASVFAYVEVGPDGGTCTGWGNRTPPNIPALSSN